jgi:hypothetical protein
MDNNFDLMISEKYFEIHSIISVAMASESAYKLNDLIIDLGKKAIEGFGEIFEVIHYKLPQKRPRLGKCYITAYEVARDYNLLYVEGHLTEIVTGKQIAHAWNVDNEGKHVDFTFNNPNKYQYKGVVIPFETVYEVNRKRSATFCILPFLEV